MSFRPNLPCLRFCGLLLLFTIVGSAQGQTRTKCELASQLQLDAPDASHLNPDNLKGERQPDEAGMESAREMGEAIHKLRIPIEVVLSSPAYRAVQTITIARLGTALIVPDLGDGGRKVQRDKSSTHAKFLKSLTAKLPRRGTDNLIVTQSPNIPETFDDSANDLPKGEVLIIKPDGIGAAPVIARIKIDEWPKLGRAP